MKKFLFGILGLLFAVPAFADTLPAGYTELEYIEGTGTQYITTDVIANQNTSAEIKFVPTSVYKSNGVFGARTSKTSNAFNIWEPGTEGIIIANISNKGTIVSNVTPVLNETYVVYLSSTRFSVNDYTITISGTENFSTPGGLQLFNIYGGDCSTTTSSEGANRIFSGKVYYFKVWQGDSLALNLIPAKNASGVVGMYDTVSGTFFTNAGTGTFTAGPAVNSCRNLFDISQTATKEFVTTDRIWTRYNIDVSSVSLSAGTWSSKHTDFISPGTYTITVNGTANGIDNIAIRGYDGSNISVLRRGNGTFTITKPTQIWIFTASPEVIAGITEIMLEQGDTATAYVPYCAPDIKIATTAYNTARFSPVVTELNDTIATIRSVVTNTINQTKAIADLQATKQTRPDEQCPAGKKCLLVEDDAGQPHWYEIIESPVVQ